MTQTDLFAEHPDDEHPIRWQPANGEEPMYLPLFEAVRRLVGYGFTEDDVTRGLLAGAPFRTPFAFYQLHERIERSAPQCMATMRGQSCSRPAVVRVLHGGVRHQELGGMLRCRQHAQSLLRAWPDSYSEQPITETESER